MIKIHRDNRVVFWLLMGVLVLNILWSLRLELQAKTTETIVQQYHLNLNKKIDKLEDLKEFSRSADEIIFGTNDKKMGFVMSRDSGQLAMHSKDNAIAIGRFLLPSGETSEQVRTSAGDAYMHQSSDDIILGFRDKKMEFVMSRDSGQLAMHSKDNAITIGRFLLPSGETSEQVRTSAGDAYMHQSSDDIILGFRTSRNRPFHLSMNSKDRLIELRHQDSIFRVGKTPQGEGIAMGEKDSGSLIIRKDKGIGLTSTKKIILESRGEHAELSIVADGDINIRSRNGVVKINGKKIHMNK
jgi:hypothetical protein